MVDQLPFLDPRVPIVDENGCPTHSFALWFQQNVGKLIEAHAEAQKATQTGEDNTTALADKADKDTQIIAGTGLTGGGDLSADRTINLEDTTVVPGTYAPPTSITVDAQGRITAIS